LDDLLGHCPALPIRATLRALSKALRREPVAKILLVEAGLATTGSIPFQRPVARRVGRERLVDEDELVIVDEPELELGIGDDEPARGRVLRSSTVQLQRDVGNAIVEICTDESRRCCSKCRGSVR
jgi:hypothetical protein